MADPYAWLRDREDPQVLAHLNRENVHAEYNLAHQQGLRRQLYQEILDRVDLSRRSVPVRHGPYEYYSRNESDQPYAIYCRRSLHPDAPEEIILDENMVAAGNGYFALGLLSVSPDHSRCIFGIDTTANERLTLFVTELARRPSVVAAVPGAAAAAAWANDNQTFFSIQLDDRNRPFALVRHRMVNGTITDDVVFEERDDAFRLRLGRTESGRFLVLTSWAHDTTELHYASADEPTGPLRLLHRRQPGIEAYATHHAQAFYILTNEDAPGKKIITVPIADPAPSKQRIFIDARAAVEISYVQAFTNHLIVCERRDGLPQLRIIDLRTRQDHLVALPEPLYALYPEDNREFETESVRFGYNFPDNSVHYLQLSYGGPKPAFAGAVDRERVRPGRRIDRKGFSLLRRTAPESPCRSSIGRV